MFKKNPRPVQPYLISNVNELTEKQRKLLETSRSDTFFREFYSRVDEQPFAELYVDFPSRPMASHRAEAGLPCSSRRSI